MCAQGERKRENNNSQPAVNPTLYGSVFENNRNYSVSQTHVTCGPLAVEHSSSLLLSFVLLSNLASFSTKTPNILIHIFCLVSISLSLSVPIHPSCNTKQANRPFVCCPHFHKQYRPSNRCGYSLLAFNTNMIANIIKLLHII